MERKWSYEYIYTFVSSVFRKTRFLTLVFWVEWIDAIDFLSNEKLKQFSFAFLPSTAVYTIIIMDFVFQTYRFWIKVIKRKGAIRLKKCAINRKRVQERCFHLFTAKRVTHNTILYCIGSILLISFNITYYLNFTVFVYFKFWNSM